MTREVKESENSRSEDENDSSGEVYATGEFAWTPDSGTLPPNMHEDETDETSGPYASGDDFAEQEITIVSKKRKTDLQYTAKQEEKMISVVAGLNKSIDRIVKATETSSATSYPMVLEMLAKLPGVQEGDSLYTHACNLFLKPDYREMFVALKRDDLHLQWLKMQFRNGKQGTSIPVVLEMLAKLPGVQKGDSLYMRARDLFLKPVYREMFVALKRDDLRLQWLLDMQFTRP